MTKHFDEVTERYIADTFGADPPCFTCKHYHGGASCDAFDVIPDEIFGAENDHKKPYEGDGGIQYEPA